MASSYDPAWRHRAGVNDSRRTGKVTNDDRADWRAAWALFPGDVAYVWHARIACGRRGRQPRRAAAFEIRAQIIWAKDRLVWAAATITGNTNRAGTRFGAAAHWAR